LEEVRLTRSRQIGKKRRKSGFRQPDRGKTLAGKREGVEARMSPKEKLAKKGKKNK